MAQLGVASPKGTLLHSLAEVSPSAKMRQKKFVKGLGVGQDGVLRWYAAAFEGPHPVQPVAVAEACRTRAKTECSRDGRRYQGDQADII